MNRLRILGPSRLSGEVRSQGAKNAALPIMAASLLASEPVTLRGVPRLLDVETLSQLLEHLGLSVARHRDDCLRIITEDPRPIAAPRSLVQRMRASFCVLGPLLAMRGTAIVPLPGGCDIGPRPVDLHLAGMAALGADLRIERGMAIVTAKRLRGATMELSGPRGPTVTGTANVLSAATLARGTSVIRRAAREPEIVDLVCFLRSLGADIEGEGTDTIVVRGVRELGGGEHTIIPDRIEAGTLLMAAAITGSTVTVRSTRPDHLHSVLEALAMTGQRISVDRDAITLVGADRPRPAHLTAGPFPEFPSDLQAPMTALLSLADGNSSITERVFPTRWRHIAELRRLGAKIDEQGCRTPIRGTRSLAGATIMAHDLRGGAALVLAAIAAEGETIVRGLEHLDRGYERLEEKLCRLGADIERIDTPTAAPAISGRPNTATNRRAALLIRPGLGGAVERKSVLQS